MFAPPPIIDTEVFTRLPDGFRMRDRSSQWADGQPGGFGKHSLLEGPCFDRHGNLYIVDVPYGRIFRVNPEGGWTLVAEYDGEPNGLKFHRDGRGFVADYKNGVMQLDAANGHVRPYLTRHKLEHFKALNDLTFSSTGDLYFTDQGLTGMHDPTGRVFRLRADGRLDCLLDNVPSPNGLVLDLDERTLFVAVTRANAVWRVPLIGEGVAKVGVFIQLSGGIGPDGITIDEEGNLAVCHIGMGCVWLFNRRGEPLYRVQSCVGAHTTNVCYGGPDRRWMYVTEAETGSIIRAHMPTPGRVPFGLT